MPQAVVNVHRAIVRVIARNGKERSIGSGIHIGDGLVLTAAHVVAGGLSFEMVALREQYSPATLLAIDERLDIALLRMQTPPPTSAALASAVPRIGSRVISAGFGSDRKLKWNFGRVESFTGRGEQTGMFWSGRSRSGDSGGPTFNMQGFVVGILSGTTGRSTHGTHVGKLRAFCKPWRGKKPAPQAKTQDALWKELATLKAEIALLKKVQGPHGAKGPQGPQGAKGSPGDSGMVDYQRIVDELAKRPITVQIVDVNGKVKQQQKVYLGGTLRLRHRPIGD